MLSNEIILSDKVQKIQKYKYSWELFQDVVDEFNAGKHDFKTIGADTATRAYESAMEYIVNTKLKGIHPSVLMKENDSSGYSMLNEELQKQFGKMLNSDYGTIITAHAKYKDIVDIKGIKRKQLVPDTGGSFGRWLMGEVDIIIYLDKNENGERIFRLEGTKDYNAKQRLNFDKDIINVECPDPDDPNPGKYAYEVFKKEFDKAIEKLNKNLGITQEMIDGYQESLEKEEKLDELIPKIIKIAKDLNLNGTKNAKVMKEVVGCESIKELNYDQAKKYLKYLKEDYK